MINLRRKAIPFAKLRFFGRGVETRGGIIMAGTARPTYNVAEPKKPYPTVEEWAMSKRVLVIAVLMIAILACTSGCSSKSSEEVKLGGIDLTEMLQGLLDRTSRTLSSVRDMKSAKAAAVDLRAINDDFDDMIYHVPKLSYAGQEELGKKAQKSMPMLQQAVRHINESPAMSEILGAEMNAMFDKLGVLATGNAGFEGTE
jgi:hypothetical protein